MTALDSINEKYGKGVLIMGSSSHKVTIEPSA
ncbi:hypothetical protein [Polaromonas sp.]